MWYNEPMKHIIQFTITKDKGVAAEKTAFNGLAASGWHSGRTH
jgi:hypothetical protein